MSKDRILIVEDDFDISNMLHIYFGGQGYAVQVVPRGNEALALIRQQVPHLIVLDIMLPDMDGYAVCKELRSTTRTSHIPIIFLTQRDERSDKIAGLELGADDYITKPFALEELRLRVQNAIARSERESLTDPHSGLPSGRLIEDQLRSLMRQDRPWTYTDLKIKHFAPFKVVYGFVAGQKVLRFTALLISEIVNELGTPDDFVGHPGGDSFLVITFSNRAQELGRRLQERFNEEVLTHYSFIDREAGKIKVDDATGGQREVPLMSLSIGQVSAATHQFSDIREITQLAAENRRRGQQCSTQGEGYFDGTHPT
jgi:DNA-binding response OmpR family regulator